MEFEDSCRGQSILEFGIDLKGLCPCGSRSHRQAMPAAQHLIPEVWEHIGLPFWLRDLFLVFHKEFLQEDSFNPTMAVGVHDLHHLKLLRRLYGALLHHSPVHHRLSRRLFLQPHQLQVMKGPIRYQDKMRQGDRTWQLKPLLAWIVVLFLANKKLRWEALSKFLGCVLRLHQRPWTKESDSSKPSPVKRRTFQAGRDSPAPCDRG